MGLRLGPFYLASFDGYDLYYPESLNLRAEAKGLQEFKRLLEKEKDNYNMIISSSHYQLMCSIEGELGCNLGRTILKPYTDLMFMYEIPLYLGAHAHTYERSYPFFQN